VVAPQAATDMLRGDGLVLQRGHADCILVKYVEKPTDNGPVCLLCYDVADADSLAGVRHRWPRRISRPPSTRLGPAAISTEVPGPVLRAGPDVDTKTQAPKGITRRGLRSRAGRHHRVEPHAEVITPG
jgi:hypothetical protein